MLWKKIRHMKDCLGLQSRISIVENFFGYTQSWRSDFADCLDPTQPNCINQNRAGCLTYPETPFVRLSVLDQINHYWNDQNVYLHLRIGTNPNIIGKNPKISINKMIYAMRKCHNVVRNHR